MKRLKAIFRGMLQRTENKNNAGYEFYGEKGVKVCQEWKKDRTLFYKWALQNGYSDNLTIDRKESSGDYSPSNCRWITQTKNVKRSNGRDNIESRPYIKISIDVASEVCEAYDTGEFTERGIASELNVSRTAISHILRQARM